MISTTSNERIDMSDENNNEVAEKTLVKQVKESVDFVVDMMNSGKVNPKDVYPPGRYCGD
jgi:hypothetical protein